MNFISGGRVGDFIHCLFAVNEICSHLDEKADFYLIDGVLPLSDGWTMGLDKTIEELRPILERQEYFGSLQKYTGQDIEYICLDSWRVIGFLYSCNWTLMLRNSYGLFKSGVATSWMRYPVIDGDLKDCLLLHRSSNAVRWDGNFPLETIIKKWTATYGKGKVKFLVCRKEEWELFPYRESGLVEEYHVRDLRDIFMAVNSCRLFVGNQSAPFAIASALDKPRICEVSTGVEQVMYNGEEFHFPNYLTLQPGVQDDRPESLHFMQVDELQSSS